MSEGEVMLKKASIVLSVFAVLGLGFAAATPSSAQAQQRNVHVKKNVHVNKRVNVHRNVTVHRNVRVHRNVGTRYVIGRRYNGHIWYGRNRHFWRGRWYAYGVGPCWINVGGLFFWNVAVCPL
jgi:hypothetical protein